MVVSKSPSIRRWRRRRRRRRWWIAERHCLHQPTADRHLINKAVPSVAAAVQRHNNYANAMARGHLCRE